MKGYRQPHTTEQNVRKRKDERVETARMDEQELHRRMERQTGTEQSAHYAGSSHVRGMRRFRCSFWSLTHFPSLFFRYNKYSISIASQLRSKKYRLANTYERNVQEALSSPRRFVCLQDQPTRVKAADEPRADMLGEGKRSERKGETKRRETDRDNNARCSNDIQLNRRWTRAKNIYTTPLRASRSYLRENKRTRACDVSFHSCCFFFTSPLVFFFLACFLLEGRSSNVLQYMNIGSDDYFSVHLSALVFFGILLFLNAVVL